jgi:hypothetical protein
MTDLTLSEKLRVEGVDYELIEDYHEDKSRNAAFKHLASGLIFEVGTVGFSEDVKGSGEFIMKFDFNVLENPNNATIDNQMKVEIGDIVVSAMIAALENEPREDNTERSDNR